MRVWTVAAVVVVAVGCREGGHEIDTCTQDGLAEALSIARSGEVVRIGACEVTGAFAVPAGVRLQGVGPESVVRAADGAVALTLDPGSPASRLVDLTVASGGRAAIVAQGSGRVVLESLAIEVEAGIGIGAEGLDRLEAADVVVTGPVTAESAPDLDVPFDPARTATVGLALVEVAEAALEGVSVRGFARAGAILFESGSPESPVTWSGGDASGNVASGLVVWGGAAAFDDVQLSGNLRGPVVRAYGGLFGADAEVSSTGLEVVGNEGTGLFQYDGARATHEDLVAGANDFGGVWMQETEGLTLEGTGTELGDNGFVGVVAIDAVDAHVSDAFIRGTTLRAQSTDDGDVECGDGFQFVRSTGVELHDVTSQFNERIQGLFDQGGGTPDGLVIEGVIVDGDETQLGCIDQNGDFPGSWDDGMDRRSGTGERDEEFEDAGGRLDVAEIVGPQELPEPLDVVADGLDALLER